MQICQKHWDLIKQAVKDHGMWHLCAQNEEEGKAKLEALVKEAQEIQDGESPTTETVDPLLQINFMIMQQALQQGGLYLLGLNEQGKEFCPVCEACNFGGTEEHWTVKAVQAFVPYYRERGILPPLS